jgi:nickel-dependent lactate racemase
VLALEPGVPQAAEIVAAIVKYLLAAGLDADSLAVMQTIADVDGGSGDPRRCLPEEVRKRLALHIHDPSQAGQLAYLAATEEGEPVLLNRAIVDADVVLPIGCIGNRRSPDYHGIHGVVYPTFSDRKTLTRFLAPGLLNPRAKRKKDLVKTCNDVGWLLGVNFTIQVIPGAGEDVLQVLAGEVGVVRRRGWELYREAWECSVPRRAALVVAAIEGGKNQQTWHNVGLALSVATSLVEEGGAIAVCCDLATEPGPGLRLLAESDSRQEALRHIHKERPEDALIAAQLADTLDRVTVYLLSGLEEELVERLEIAPLTEPEEVVRLTRRYPSCILLSNAVHARVTSEEEA